MLRVFWGSARVSCATLVIDLDFQYNEAISRSVSYHNIMIIQFQSLIIDM